MKTRSSSGVGQKVDLEFNVDTLRISDLGEDDDQSSYSNKPQSPANNVYSGLKRTSTVSTTTDPETGEIRDIDPKMGTNLKINKQENNSPLIRKWVHEMPNLNPEKD
jgi:hypothetical protein